MILIKTRNIDLSRTILEIIDWIGRIGTTYGLAKLTLRTLRFDLFHSTSYVFRYNIMTLLEHVGQILSPGEDTIESNFSPIPYFKAKNRIDLLCQIIGWFLMTGDAWRAVLDIRKNMITMRPIFEIPEAHIFEW